MHVHTCLQIWHVWQSQYNFSEVVSLLALVLKSNSFYHVPFPAEPPSLLLTQPYFILIMQSIGLELLTKECVCVCK